MKEFFRGSFFSVFLVFVIFTKATVINSNDLRFRGFFSKSKNVRGTVKEYTGHKKHNNTMIVAYYYEQTIAVVELASNMDMFSCELLEVRSPEDQKIGLEKLKSKVNYQEQIKFNEMKNLMRKCQLLEYPNNLSRKFVKTGIIERRVSIGEFKSLLSGVFPGTKWCGRGDIAGSYYDLGTEKELDKCCRTHDFCPIKIFAFDTKYNVTNSHYHTRSHCDCDEIFYHCLKDLNTKFSELIGNFYFNVGELICVAEAKKGGKLLITKNFQF